MELAQSGSITPELAHHVAGDWLTIYSELFPHYWKDAWDAAGAETSEASGASGAFAVFVSDRRDALVSVMQRSALATLIQCADALRHEDVPLPVSTGILLTVYGMDTQPALQVCQVAIQGAKEAGIAKATPWALPSGATEDPRMGLEPYEAETGIPGLTEDHRSLLRRAQREGRTRNLERFERLSEQETVQAYDAGRIDYERRIDDYSPTAPLKYEVWQLGLSRTGPCDSCAAIYAQDARVPLGEPFPMPSDASGWAVRGYGGGVRPGWHARCVCSTSVVTEAL